MSSHNKKVQPTQFDLASKPQADDGPMPSVHRQESGPPSWVIPALGALLLVGAIVVFWLPGRVASPQLSGETESGLAGIEQIEQIVPTLSPEPAASDEASPWSDAQMAKLRKEAQDVLEELLDVQFQLQERGVTRWAPEPFGQATAEAQQGDALYKERKFEEAKISYEGALTQLLTLEAAMPETFEAQLELARSALEQGDAQTIGTSLELAELIDPSETRLAELRVRESALPEVQQLLKTAAEAEPAGNLAAAEQALMEALQKDPQHLYVAQELARVSKAYIQEQFNNAMSDGYLSLDESKFDSARAAFRRADKLQPGSTEAASATQEVAAAQTAARLAELKRSGAEAERKEAWQDAVTAYTTALEIDANILFARDGRARSAPRARLDKQFQAAIDEPNRLADMAVAELTATLIQQADTFQPKGPVLTEQLRKLEQLLALANTSITVTLQSDLETEVIVYKVARLGRFEQRQLDLRPGTYTAVGTRNGYRDTRRTFEIRHNSPAVPIVIACTETI
jgi:tetratricopeptide (TPR) repeat protein